MKKISILEDNKKDNLYKIMRFGGPDFPALTADKGGIVIGERHKLFWKDLETFIGILRAMEEAAEITGIKEPTGATQLGTGTGQSGQSQS